MMNPELLPREDEDEDGYEQVDNDYIAGLLDTVDRVWLGDHTGPRLFDEGDEQTAQETGQ